ncbi:TetR/AcrR family transcriptional regulator [Streptomyces liangshanensis]|uniref:TetR/AcrR family transcriptional regulator n=1 Tax=Streptomyces liangshanensis TaxID=2717324 RepID=UPI0036DCC58B
MTDHKEAPDSTGGSNGKTAQRSRRIEYAELTRQAVIGEARRLFAEKGYFATKIEDIATAARVSPATVYAVGGKRGLLAVLIDIWSAAPEIAPARKRLEAADSADAVLREVARLTREMRLAYGDIMRLVLTTAPHDTSAASGLELATRRYRDGTATAARRLAELRALREGIDAEQALDILWFFFGYSGFFTLVDDNGWTYDQAENWLLSTARQTLLGQDPA